MRNNSSTSGIGKTEKKSSSDKAQKTTPEDSKKVVQPEEVEIPIVRATSIKRM